MAWRVLDISQNDRILSLSRNAIKVTCRGEQLGLIPIADIQALLIHGHGSSLSLNLASALANAQIPIVLCDQNHMPNAMVLPVTGNFEQALRIQAQSAASEPLKKRLWKILVQQKIKAQAEALSLFDSKHSSRLGALQKAVRSGDPENLEAQAAQIYWKALMGQSFRRDREQEGVNAALNYGYAVVRAAMSRAVVSVGLSPSLGIHHRSRLNAFQLVDDLMEPFRPVVDRAVRDNIDAFSEPLHRDTKAILADVANLPMSTDKGQLAVQSVMTQICHSLAQCYSDKKPSLWHPASWLIKQQGSLNFEE
jgi:CRISPR-associated protein Cas1